MDTCGKRFIFAMVTGVLCLTIIGCAPSRSVRINTLFESPYKPNFNNIITDNQKGFTGYTIGIISPEFTQPDVQIKGQHAWAYRSPREQQLLNEFKREISNAVEKILLSKGNKVQGPFASYQEMTYPERERCTFLIKPTFIIDLNAAPVSPPRALRGDIGGPSLEAYAYAENQVNVTGSAQIEYLILDPLTQEKLERHKLKSPEFSLSYRQLYQGYYDKKSDQPHNFTPLDTWADKINDYQGYNDPNNVSAKILDALYQSFVPQLAQLISVEEFRHLQKYQQQLKEKKVY